MTAVGAPPPALWPFAKVTDTKAAAAPPSTLRPYDGLPGPRSDTPLGPNVCSIPAKVNRAPTSVRAPGLDGSGRASNSVTRAGVSATCPAVTCVHGLATGGDDRAPPLRGGSPSGARPGPAAHRTPRLIPLLPPEDLAAPLPTRAEPTTLGGTPHCLPVSHRGPASVTRRVLAASGAPPAPCPPAPGSCHPPGTPRHHATSLGRRDETGARARPFLRAVDARTTNQPRPMPPGGPRVPAPPARPLDRPTRPKRVWSSSRHRRRG